jgi:hypothetical protein
MSQGTATWYQLLRDRNCKRGFSKNVDLMQFRHTVRELLPAVLLARETETEIGVISDPGARTQLTAPVYY